VIALEGQYGFWKDSRYEAREYLLENFNEERIQYSPYALAKGMSKGLPYGERGDLLLVHESYYRRYWKSLTTPFKIPECCEEVYHCLGEEECAFYQSLLAGKSTEFKAIKRFNSFCLMPERKLYKRLFGTYETFLGDVIIFKKLEGDGTDLSSDK